MGKSFEFDASAAAVASNDMRKEESALFILLLTILSKPVGGTSSGSGPETHP
jgi:hypothetical protein